jgi:hypothetical protein
LFLLYNLYMSAFDAQPIVGLFGTCGDTTFREDLFIPEYTRLGIDYFNPQVPDWKPELADIESGHLAHDVVQCWPVLDTTYGGGSLAETGYSIVSSLRALSPLPKFIIPMIEPAVSQALIDADPVAAKESARARALVATHLSNIVAPNVFVVASLEEMLETSITLFTAARSLVALSSRSPAYQRFMEGREQQAALARAMESGLLGSAAAALATRDQ